MIGGKHRVFVLLAVAAATGCQQNPEEDRMSEPPPPPASIIAPIQENMSLTEKLERLQAELDAVLAHGDIDDYARTRIYRAEAITDRILETELPFAWLQASYSVEAWLRQLQAMADRIVAQIRRSESEERILGDVARLRESVMVLRTEISREGGPMPPPLDSLLAWYEVDSMPTRIPRDSIGI